MNTLTERDAAWLAGILEADGSFRRHNHPDGRYRIYVSLEMIDEDVVRCAHELTGVGNVGELIRKPRSDGKQWQTTYRWSVQAKADVLKLVEVLEPFIVAKRRHAQIASLRS